VRRLALALALLAALAFAPQAFGKGALHLCGADGCVFLAPEGPDGPPVPLGGRASDSIGPVAPAPFYTLTFAEIPNEAIAYWIPGAGVVRVRAPASGALWLPVDADARALLEHAAAGLTAFAAPSACSALVDHRLARGGASYLGLYTAGTPTVRWPRSVVWVPLQIFGSLGNAPTPWTDGINSLWIARKGGYLRRDGQVVRISPTLARRIRARLSLS